MRINHWPADDRQYVPRLSLSLLVVATLTLGVGSAAAAPVVGGPAPAFSAYDSNGDPQTLDAYRGSIVVLEWTNHDCPFVRKHYDAGAMQSLQRHAKAQGVVWLSVISSAPGEQGHVSPRQANDLTQSRMAEPTAVILDPEGVMGRAYEAKTTPHMFIIDPDGMLAYMGAIDDDSSARGNPASARNYVRQALAELVASRPVTTPVTRPYGCSVKYRPGG